MNKMKFYNQLSIRQKIISIILTVTIVSVITGFTIEIISNFKTSRTELKNDITLNAKLTADYLVPTFLFNDQAGAKEILMKLSNIPAVIYGAAYDPAGTLHAEYKSSAFVDSVKSFTGILKSAEEKSMIIIREPVKSKDEVLGTLILIASTDIIREKTNSHIKSVLSYSCYINFICHSSCFLARTNYFRANTQAGNRYTKDPGYT